MIRKILVFGGRDFTELHRFGNVMDFLHSRYKFTHVIHGACNLKKRTGADFFADEWAKCNGVQPVACEALWEFHRQRGHVGSAGPIRNDAMLGLEPEYALKCPGGRGTANMLKAFRIYMSFRRSVRLFDLDGPKDDYEITMRSRHDLASSCE